MFVQINTDAYHHVLSHTRKHRIKIGGQEWKGSYGNLRTSAILYQTSHFARPLSAKHLTVFTQTQSLSGVF